jgi:hypothetical protein
MFPSLKHNGKHYKYKTKSKQVYVPDGATVEDMERVNDRMSEEVTQLVVTLEASLEKAKLAKKKYVYDQAHTDGIYDKDPSICA